MAQDLTDHYRFRDDLASVVVRDLIGPLRGQDPTGDEMTLTEPPMQRYLAGVLYPQTDDPIDPTEDDDVASIDDERGDDPAENQAVSLANAQYPSSMGLTFSVDLNTTNTIEVEITAATYVGDQLPETNGGDADEEDDGAMDHGRPGLWRRKPVRLEPLTLTLTGSEKVYTEALRDDIGLNLYVKERRAEQGVTTVTLALTNTNKPTGWPRDPHCYFQCELSVATPNGRGFVDRTKSTVNEVDLDAGSSALLYRNSAAFAIGHGTGVEWDDHQTSGGTHRTGRIRTTPAPSYELRLADSNPKIKSDFFSMHKLATGDRAEVTAGLRAFADGYAEWIKARQKELDELPDHHRSTGERHLGDCREAARRIGEGISLLETNNVGWRAFQLANRAMLEQRARAEWTRGDRSGEPDVTSEAHEWRPFQLGFILMTVRGVAEKESDDRSLVDLLWFPTGGGKTEAYLGLIAFTIFGRRLRAVTAGGKGDGLTVIMRYTLRLLTLQQFQRATMLICACERIRREHSDELGEEEISICLWVGGAATPLTLKDTRQALDRIRSGGTVSEGNPVQFTECPWCSESLSARNYWVADFNPRLVITCPNEACDFHKGLPAYLVDEDVYNHKPTLMIATVDKFASMPWRQNIGDLFNVDSDEHPPELIIQDELHLISGPLGTMVALYETAVEMLCVDGGIGPKVIASTATIRRATAQIRRLYASDAFQFPPPGLDATDSYFAVEAPPAEKGTRRYLGLMAPGKSHATLLVRSYGSLLQRASELTGGDDVVDPYWTLLGYFNSLRVLGAANMQIRDDVDDWMDVIATRSGQPRRKIDAHPSELTSRADASKIPETLDRMGNHKSTGDCIDVILATNMISVGVDVDRLGLMAVMGQPQSTSEYIQATSRVGRRFPGLVVVLYNATKSRDRSHYEDFVGFHNAIYRQVDATSLTPFAARARDRALHAVFIGMMRAMYPEYRSNGGASDVGNLDARASNVIGRIVDRVRGAHRKDPDQEAVEAVADAVAAHLNDIVDNWKQRAESEPKLVFRHATEPSLALLSDAAHPDLADRYDSFNTMWSMRSVDTESGLYLIR